MMFFLPISSSPEAHVEPLYDLARRVQPVYYLTPFSILWFSLCFVLMPTLIEGCEGDNQLVYYLS